MLLAFLQQYQILSVLLLKRITIPRQYFPAEKSTWTPYKNKFSEFSPSPSFPFSSSLYYYYCTGGWVITKIKSKKDICLCKSLQKTGGIVLTVVALVIKIKYNFKTRLLSHPYPLLCLRNLKLICKDRSKRRKCFSIRITASEGKQKTMSQRKRKKVEKVSMASQLHYFFSYYLFIRLHRVLVAARGIFVAPCGIFVALCGIFVAPCGIFVAL